MTRHQIINRVTAELEALWPGETQFEPATVSDVDQLINAIGETLDDVREQLASAQRDQETPP